MPQTIMTSILTLWGMTSRDRYLEMLRAFPPDLRDKAKLNGNRPPSAQAFEGEYTQAYLDPAWYGAMRRSGLSFSWEAVATDEDQNTSGGIALFHAPSQQDFSYSLIDGEISLLLAELKGDPEEAIRNAKLCEAYWIESDKVGLFFACSAHEKMEQMAQSLELRGYLARSVSTPTSEV